MRELGLLFRDMITSPQSCVNPTQELARLTLISPSNEAAIRRRSTISAGISLGLGKIDGMPVLGPQGPPQSVAENQSGQLEACTDNKFDVKEEGSHPMTEASDNKEMAMSAQSAHPPSASDRAHATLTEQNSGPPTRPPPVPPRPTPEVNRQKQLLEEVEIGAQQDVTEVINNVLFQSQCAIKPREVADDGEQLDQVKE